MKMFVCFFFPTAIIRCKILSNCNKGCCCFAHITTALNLIVVKKLGGIFLLFPIFLSDKIKKDGKKKCSMNKI